MRCCKCVAFLCRHFNYSYQNILPNPQNQINPISDNFFLMAFPASKKAGRAFAAIFCWRKRISALSLMQKYSPASGSQANTQTSAMATSGFPQQKLFVPQSICFLPGFFAFNTRRFFFTNQYYC